MAKLDIARRHGKPVDGHAPGLQGEEARRYIEAGISTDHECFTIDEALEKIGYGMKILIREGSAAKNFDALADLLHEHADHIMFCSDDRHPNDLVREHVNSFITRAISKGHDPLKVLRSCIYNPVRHYNLDVGLLQEGDDADMVVVDNLDDFNILQTYIRGQKVAEQGQTLIKSVTEEPINKFNTEKLVTQDLQVIPRGSHIKVIQAMDGQLITHHSTSLLNAAGNNVESDPEKDILKLVVYNRYQKAKPAIAFVNGFGLKEGAIASSVAHDSHNIIAAGVTDQDIATAINMLVESKGGVSLAGSDGRKIVPLPIAGLMSTADGYDVAANYESLDKQAKAMGSTLHAPYMTLSFMALLVIPDLKLSDQGLFDGRTFGFTSLFTEPVE
jgi:adenine deaminase